MRKAKDTRKDLKKKTAKGLMENRAAKREKRASRASRFVCRRRYELQCTAVGGSHRHCRPDAERDLGYVNPALYEIAADPAKYAADFFHVTEVCFVLSSPAYTEHDR